MAPWYTGWPAACLLLVLLVAGAYWPAPTLEWVGYDDAQYISENPLVLQGVGWEAAKQAFLSLSASNWHPLTWISHQLDVSLFGLNAAGHHLHNVLLHLASALVLFGFFRLATRERFPSVWPAFFVAALFAAHPLRVESVAWLAERKDVLSGFFWMCTMALYLRYARSPGLLRYLLVFACMAVGLTAKPMLVTLPVALLLLDYWPLGRMRLAPQGCAPRDSWTRILLEKLPLLGLAAASSWITMIAQRGAMGSWEHLPLQYRFFNALHSYMAYLWQTVWPHNLAPYYPHPGEGLPLWLVGLCGAGILVATGGAWLLRRRAPWLLPGWLWHLATLVPVIGIIQVGGQSMADRYTYIPSIGIATALVYSIAFLLQGRSRLLRRSILAAGFAVLALLALLTQQQVRHWENAETLFTHSLEVAPSDLAHNNLGKYYASLNQNRKALYHFGKAMELNPASYVAVYNRGRMLFDMGQRQEAVKLLQQALRLKPDIYQAHEVLAKVLLDIGQPQIALKHLGHALRNAPPKRHADLLNMVAQAQAYTGNVSAARQTLQRVLQIDPGNAVARTNLQRLMQPGK